MLQASWSRNSCLKAPANVPVRGVEPPDDAELQRAGELRKRHELARLHVSDGVVLHVALQLLLQGALGIVRRRTRGMPKRVRHIAVIAARKELRQALQLQHDDVLVLVGRPLGSVALGPADEWPLHERVRERNRTQHGGRLNRLNVRKSTLGKLDRSSEEQIRV